MTRESSPRRAPVVLVVDDQEVSAQSLESVLMPNGFATLRAFTGARGLERARTHAPDVVVVARTLPDTDGLALCRALRDELVLGDRVPVLVTLHEPPTRVERLAALRAGAWDVLVPPVDVEELVLRLDTYVQAKCDADKARETGLVDGRTGFYNQQGLQRRATELGAWAQRQGESLSCVILGLLEPGSANDAAVVSAVDAIAEVLRKAGRHSDVIGRMGHADFVVLAPRTDANQAVRLAERLGTALRSGARVGDGGQEPGAALRAGYDSVTDARQTPLRGAELITRAAIALGRARAERQGDWLRPFGAPPPTSPN